MKLTKLLIGMALIGSFFLINNNVSASYHDGITIKPMLSGLPVIDNSQYFRLLVESNSHYVIPLDVDNNTNQTFYIDSIIKNADTDSSGNIIYNNVKKKPNNIVSKIVGTNHKVYKIKSHSHIIIKYDIFSGTKMFSGTQLAGIITTFYTHPEMKNVLSYINGISITENPLSPDVRKLRVTTGQLNYRYNKHVLTLENNNPLLFQHLKLNVYNNSQNLSTLRDISIAPYSHFHLSLPDSNRKLHPDNIHLKINGIDIMRSSHSNAGYNHNRQITISLLTICAIICISLILWIKKKGKK